LRQTCAELGIDGAVDFLGYRPQESLPEVCRSSDVLVLPSLVEPWGLVVNEAMFCRTPVIVSRQCGCAADLVTPETGWCFSPQRQSELEAAILGAATSSDETLAAMGDAAYQLALHYTPEKCADRIIEGLSRLGSSQPGGLRCVRESSANKSIADHAERTP
jgi:glycosyltransferase involved in cell wall biosynthesis